MIALLQVVAIVTLAPLLHGVMKSLRARLAGRPGPHPLQPYRDLWKLWHKESVLPEGSSPLALLAPGLSFGVAIVFAASLGSGFVDVVALALLLALGRFALVLAALDSRSGFAGMAASREMTFASLVEPALVVALLGGAALGRGASLSSLVDLPFGIAGTLAIAAFVLVLLSETARVPVDNQETHYELTMIHEGLVLEYAGWQLAILAWASQVRQLCFFALAALLLPGAGLAAHVAWIVSLAGAITIVETLFAKVRLFEVPQLLATALILALASICFRLGIVSLL